MSETLSLAFSGGKISNSLELLLEPRFKLRKLFFYTEDEKLLEHNIIKRHFSKLNSSKHKNTYSIDISEIIANTLNLYPDLIDSRLSLFAIIHNALKIYSAGHPTSAGFFIGEAARKVRLKQIDESRYLHLVDKNLLCSEYPLGSLSKKQHIALTKKTGAIFPPAYEIEKIAPLNLESKVRCQFDECHEFEGLDLSQEVIVDSSESRYKSWAYKDVFGRVTIDITREDSEHSVSLFSAKTQLLLATCCQRNFKKRNVELESL